MTTNKYAQEVVRLQAEVTRLTQELESASSACVMYRSQIHDLRNELQAYALTEIGKDSCSLKDRISELSLENQQMEEALIKIWRYEDMIDWRIQHIVSEVLKKVGAKFMESKK